jgi:HNH endonuclease
MANDYISPNTKNFLFEQASGCCEYCKSPADFTTEFFSVEHIIPKAKGGSNEISNLAFACIGCNILKSDKTEFLDSVSQKIVAFFNPRIMNWHEHFMWDETFTIILGQTAIGRATVDALQLNRRQVKNLRRALIAIGEHPPK